MSRRPSRIPAGRCIRARGTEDDATGAWVTVMVVDECASCGGDGDVDFSTTALKDITGYSWDRKRIKVGGGNCRACQVLAQRRRAQGCVAPGSSHSARGGRQHPSAAVASPRSPLGCRSGSGPAAMTRTAAARKARNRGAAAGGRTAARCGCDRSAERIRRPPPFHVCQPSVEPGCFDPRT